MAGASLFCAAKATDEARSDLDVAGTLWAAKAASTGAMPSPLAPSGRLASWMRQAIREAELRMLRDCGFLLPEGPEVPSTLLPPLLRMLGADGVLTKQTMLALRAVLRTREAATMPSAAAACAAVSLGADMAGHSLPIDACAASSSSSGNRSCSSGSRRGGSADWAAAVHPSTADSAAVLEAARRSLEEGSVGGTGAAWEWPEGLLSEEARAQRRQAELDNEAELKDEAAFEQKLKDEAAAADAASANAAAAAAGPTAGGTAAPPGSVNARRWG